MNFEKPNLVGASFLTAFVIPHPGGVAPEAPKNPKKPKPPKKPKGK